jgi:hypothetical protein
MMKARLTLALALLLVCTGAGAARAQGTPDHMPPALETVCDMERGAAYGHCNAYCEAMDCELANDSDPLTQPHASANACAKVRAKFQQTTGRDVPCEVTCPCNVPEIPTFSGFVSGQIPITTCITGLSGGPASGILVGSPQGTAISFLSTDQWVCGLFPFGPALPITPAQGQYCAQLLQQAADSQSVTCEGAP